MYVNTSERRFALLDVQRKGQVHGPRSARDRGRKSLVQILPDPLGTIDQLRILTDRVRQRDLVQILEVTQESIRTLET